MGWGGVGNGPILKVDVVTTNILLRKMLVVKFSVYYRILKIFTYVSTYRWRRFTAGLRPAATSFGFFGADFGAKKTLLLTMWLRSADCTAVKTRPFQGATAGAGFGVVGSLGLLT